MGASNVIPFPARGRHKGPRANESLDALSRAIVERASRKGILLRESTVQMIIEALATAPAANPASKDR